MFERFDERARSAVVWAQEQARTLGHDHIGSEHILLGLIVKDDRFSPESIAAQTLKTLDITEDRVRASVLQFTGVGEAPTTGSIPVSADGKAALERALVESQRLGHDWVGPGHILLALGRDSDSLAARVLLDLDADPEKIWATLRRLFLASGGQREGGALVQRGAGGARGSTVASVTSTVPSGFHVSLSADVRRLGMSAAARALDDGRSEIEIQDLLLALTRDETSVALLSALGIDLVAAREAIERERRSAERPDAKS